MDAAEYRGVFQCSRIEQLQSGSEGQQQAAAAAVPLGHWQRLTCPLATPADLYPNVQSSACTCQDLFQHSAWTVRVAGYQAADSERLKKVDFSSFYEKFNKQR